jgi:hypothetical protein
MNDGDQFLYRISSFSYMKNDKCHHTLRASMRAPCPMAIEGGGGGAGGCADGKMRWI